MPLSGTSDGSQTDALLAAFEIKPHQLQFGKLIGKGGFGEVFAGQYGGAHVAIKRLTIGKLSSDAFNDLKHEVVVMSKLHSPYVIPLLGVVLEAPHCFVIPFMPNGSLHDLLHDQARELSQRQRLQMAHDIAQGVSYLHQHLPLILHRDLKSRNVLLDEKLQAKLSDFGLAKVKDETQSTSAGEQAMMGSVAHMAPELVRGESRHSVNTDIYSLGVILWELSSRKTPFEGLGNQMLVGLQVMRNKQESRPAGDFCSDEQWSLIQSCWNLVPASRPAAAKVVEVVNAIITQHKAQAVRSWHCHAPKIPLAKDQVYALLEPTSEDIEKVICAYQQGPIDGAEIKRIQIVHNPKMERGFESQLALLQQRFYNSVCAPQWRKESKSKEETDLREKTLEKWQRFAAPHQDPDYPSVSLLPLWHGTKPEVIPKVLAGGLINLAETDVGFWGKGLYGTPEVDYAIKVYSAVGANIQHRVLFLWGAGFSLYPAVHAPGQPPDRTRLEGGPNYQNYDGCFIPVRPASSSPYEVNFYECQMGQTAKYHEVVVFNSLQMLPRYVVDIGKVEIPPTLSPIPPQPLLPAADAGGVDAIDSDIALIPETPPQVFAAASSQSQETGKEDNAAIVADSSPKTPLLQSHGVFTTQAVDLPPKTLPMMSQPEVIDPKIAADPILDKKPITDEEALTKCSLETRQFFQTVQFEDSFVCRKRIMDCSISGLQSHGHTICGVGGFIAQLEKFFNETILSGLKSSDGYLRRSPTSNFNKLMISRFIYILYNLHCGEEISDLATLSAEKNIINRYMQEAGCIQPEVLNAIKSFEKSCTLITQLNLGGKCEILEALINIIDKLLINLKAIKDHLCTEGDDFNNLNIDAFYRNNQALTQELIRVMRRLKFDELEGIVEDADLSEVKTVLDNIIDAAVATDEAMQERKPTFVELLQANMHCSYSFKEAVEREISQTHPIPTYIIAQIELEAVKRLGNRANPDSIQLAVRYKIEFVRALHACYSHTQSAGGLLSIGQLGPSAETVARLDTIRQCWETLSPTTESVAPEKDQAVEKLLNFYKHGDFSQLKQGAFSFLRGIHSSDKIKGLCGKFRHLIDIMLDYCKVIYSGQCFACSGGSIEIDKFNVDNFMESIAGRVYAELEVDIAAKDLLAYLSKNRDNVLETPDVGFEDISP